MNSELLDRLMALKDDMINVLVNKKIILENIFTSMDINQEIDEAFSTEGVLFKAVLNFMTD